MRYYDTALQAIRTRYHGPTTTLGPRISATWAGGRIYVSCDDPKMIPDRTSSQNHHVAARALVEKLGWDRGFPAEDLMLGGWFAGDCYWVWFGQDDETILQRRIG